jgi:hypothetical protein
MPLVTNLSPVPPFVWSDASATNLAQKFYRVRLTP